MLTEEKKNEGTPLGGSVFATVFAQMLESRRIPPTVEAAVELAEKAGLHSAAFQARLANEPGCELGSLSGLDEVLALSEPEKQALAKVYVYGDRTLPGKG